MLEVSRPTRKFSAEEVLHMIEAGILREGEPLELVEGELIIVSPQGPTHSSLTVRIRRILERFYGSDFHVRDHSPVRAGADSMPEPDLAVVRGEPDAYLDHLPGPEEAPLVVEISTSTRTADRRKARVYSAAGFSTYWIVDVVARRLEVRTGPVAGREYATTRLLGEDEEVPVPGTTASVKVRALLP